jgi:hypothetical protein
MGRWVQRDAQTWWAIVQRHRESGLSQGNLLADLAPAPADDAVSTETVTYTRRASKNRGDAVHDSGLRFDATVPVQVIQQPAPKVQDFWRWCDAQCHRPDLTPTNPLSKTLVYARERIEALQVFLTDPDVAIDTNPIERALRPIPMGKKNFPFAWPELGAKHIGIIQSLIVTCRLQGISPSVYLTDALQRVGQHPARNVLDLTPRRWKVLFADSPLRSDLDRPPPA